MTGTRRELLRMFVLDVIADDFEEFSKIVSETTDLSQACGMHVEQSEIAYALGELLRHGWVAAYHLSSDKPPERLDLHEATSQGVYYFTTESGRTEQLREYPDWPFNSDGSLRGDWCKPDD